MLNIQHFEPIIFKTVEEVGEDVILEEVDSIKHIFKSCTHYESAGTILGLYRDGHLIPHDTDYDIEILYNNDDLELIDNELSNMGFRLIRLMTWNGTAMQMAYYMPCGFIFDIYIYYKNKNVWTNHNDKGILIINENKTPLNNIEGYLTMRYGKDWNIPKSNKGDWGEDCGKALVKK